MIAKKLQMRENMAVVIDCFDHCVYNFDNKNMLLGEKECIANCAARAIKQNAIKSKGAS